MHVINGDPPKVGAGVRNEQGLGTGHKDWPLGRMVAVVFVICLVVWAFVIVYALGL